MPKGDELAVTPEVEELVQVPEVEGRLLLWSWPQGHRCHQAVSRHGLLPTSSWEPEQLGFDKGPTTQANSPWGGAELSSDCSYFLQVSDMAGTLHTIYVYHTPLCP